VRRDAVVELIHATSDRPLVRALLRAVRFASAGLLLALFGLGALMLATVLSLWIVVLLIGVLAVLPELLSRIQVIWPALHAIFVGIIVALVALLGLLAFDVLWAAVGLGRPPPAWGLLVAGIVVFAISYAYLRWLRAPAPAHPELWALFAFCAALLLAGVTRSKFPEWQLWVTAFTVAVAIRLFLQWESAPRLTHPLLWALLLAMLMVITLPLLGESIQGGRLSVTLLIGAAVVLAIASLYVLGLSRTGEPPWLHIGGLAVLGLAPALLVLAFVKATGAGPGHSEPASLPAANVPAVVPAGAIKHAPLLLFDSGERLHTPLDVDAMLKTGAVKLCPEGRGLLAKCASLSGAGDLENDVGNLNFETKQIEDDTNLPTTIYVHAVPDAADPHWVDYDYWWYLPDNPANTARGAMCGAGLVIPEITCFDHQSDWEGVTVVVDKASTDPVAVYYAQHDRVVNVDWQALQQADKRAPLSSFSELGDLADRPLVFVARGTHASYPFPCRTDFCESGGNFDDNQHDGGIGWPGDRACSEKGCVTALPLHVDGRGAVTGGSWNGFDGLWGSAICIAHGIYCARSDAPRAPGRQGRFKHPWCYGYALRPPLRPGEALTKVRNLPPGPGLPLPASCSPKKKKRT
jgi:hypothetical protein